MTRIVPLGGAVGVVVSGIVLAACTSSAGLLPTTDPTPSPPAPPSSTTSRANTPFAIIHPADSGAARNHLGYEFPPAPGVPEGEPSAGLVADLDLLFSTLDTRFDIAAIERVGQSGDARAAWLLSDLLRFLGPGDGRDASLAAFVDLTGVDGTDDPVADQSIWQSITDHLMAWDLPAHSDYVRWKAQLFTLVEPGWTPFFEDDEAGIDWRHVSWGGVLIDDRPLGTTTPCPDGCIPGLDDPAVTAAAGGDWYPDDAIVFGVSLNGESRAYPKNIMEVHEMVNDTVGGRRLGIPYCTLCGSAQAYLTDGVPAGVETPVLRTSGLLSRSNKVMYDLVTASVLDTFTGEALSGPLRARGVTLDQVSVVTSTWGDWKSSHPDTTIVAEDGGIGRIYRKNPLGGRDDAGPIFPIGDVDGRLPAQAKVLGVIAPNGTPVAIDVEAAVGILESGVPVQLMGLDVLRDGSGIRVVRADGTDAGGHEAFWFAWSQFHPDTLVWTLEP